MSVDEARRLLLHDAAREAWGADAALVLMEMLPPTGWGDVATRQQLEASDVATRQHLDLVEARIDTLEARFDARFETFETRVEARFETFEARIDARIADGQRRMMQWTVATIIAMTGLVTAISTAIARLT